MVTEIRPKCYTCLDPSFSAALADPTDFAGPAGRQGAHLGH